MQLVMVSSKQYGNKDVMDSQFSNCQAKFVYQNVFFTPLSTKDKAPSPKVSVFIQRCNPGVPQTPKVSSHWPKHA